MKYDSFNSQEIKFLRQYRNSKYTFLLNNNNLTIHLIFSTIQLDDIDIPKFHLPKITDKPKMVAGTEMKMFEK